MILTKLIGRIFQICFEISLWLNIILFMVAGGIIGRALSSWDDNTGIGVFLGLLIGIICDVFFGGFIIKLLHLDE